MAYLRHSKVSILFKKSIIRYAKTMDKNLTSAFVQTGYNTLKYHNNCACSDAAAVSTELRFSIEWLQVASAALMQFGFRYVIHVYHYIVLGACGFEMKHLECLQRVRIELLN